MISILPPNVSEEPITIYNKTSDGSYKRTVVGAVWFTSTNKAIYSKGALPLDAVSIYIFNFKDYVEPTEFTSKGWTIGVADKKVETVIFRGVVNLGDGADLIRKLDDSRVAKKPLTFKDNRKGVMSQQHLVIIC